jgi:hypothetical protein
MAGLLNHPEFSEANLANYLERLIERSTHPTKRQIELRQISQPKEKSKGYDAVIQSVVPFYVQLKTSYHYPGNSSSEIIKGRKTLGLSHARGAFFFRLKPERNPSDPLQHNVLYKLAQKHHAAYVAPIFFRETGLSRALTWEDWYPWSYGSLAVHEVGLTRVNFNRIRLFHELVTVVPHRPVKSATHEYSYSATREVAFHSQPEHAMDGPAQTLVEFLGGIARVHDELVERYPLERWSRSLLEELADLLEKPINSAGMVRILRSSAADCLGPDHPAVRRRPEQMFNILQPMERIRIFGRTLEMVWGIRQMAFVDIEG